MDAVCEHRRDGDMMLLPEELQVIETALRNGEVSARQAADSIHEFRSAYGAPWQRREWKEERVRIIGTRCEKCGNTSGPFVLQHTRPMHTIGDHLISLLRDHPVVLKRRTSFEKTKASIESSEEPQERPCCPKCGSTSVYFRPSIGTWRCGAHLPGRPEYCRCGHEFAKPSVKMALTPEQKRRMAKKKDAAFTRRMLTKDEIWQLVGREAVLAWLEEYRVYLSFEHTKTCCKRCAFIEDLEAGLIESRPAISRQLLDQ